MHEFRFCHCWSAFICFHWLECDVFIHHLVDRISRPTAQDLKKPQIRDREKKTFGPSICCHVQCVHWVCSNRIFSHWWENFAFCTTHPLHSNTLWPSTTIRLLTASWIELSHSKWFRRNVHASSHFESFPSETGNWLHVVSLINNFGYWWIPNTHPILRIDSVFVCTLLVTNFVPWTNNKAQNTHYRDYYCIMYRFLLNIYWRSIVSIDFEKLPIESHC